MRHRHTASVCLGNARDLLLGDGPPLSGGDPRRPPAQRAAAGAGHGRDDYPVSVLWGVAVLTPLLRHPSYDACLAELQRNATLCRLLGVETEAQVPKHWNLSRFLDVLGHPAHLSAMRASFDAMVRRLATVVPDLGRRTAGDATALNARRGEAAYQEAERSWDCHSPVEAARSISTPRGKWSESWSGSATSSISWSMSVMNWPWPTGSRTRRWATTR